MTLSTKARKLLKKQLEEWEHAGKNYKGLEIRKALSGSHLYSSAVVVKKEEKNGQVKFILNGAAWGHGVGLC